MAGPGPILIDAGLAKHVDVDDAILVVGLGESDETEACIKALQVALGANANAVARMQLFGMRDALHKQLAPDARTARRLRREHPAE